MKIREAKNILLNAAGYQISELYNEIEVGYKYIYLSSNKIWNNKKIDKKHFQKLLDLEDWDEIDLCGYFWE